MDNETKDIIHGIQSIVREFDKQGEVILYGSRARGNAEPDSDWDFLIISSRDISWDEEKKIRSSLYGYELKTGIIMSVMIRSCERWMDPRSMITPFRLYVDREGIHF